MIPLPYKLAIVGAALIGTFFLGREHGLSKYYDYRATVAAEMETLRIENERKREEADANVLAVSESWKRALDHAARNPVVRVQPHSCPGVGSQATGTGLKPDATTGLGLPSAIVDASQCETLINAGVRDASQVLHLQEYINGLCRAYGCE